jgi:hypothetical protein
MSNFWVSMSNNRRRNSELPPDTPEQANRHRRARTESYVGSSTANMFQRLNIPLSQNNAQQQVNDGIDEMRSEVENISQTDSKNEEQLIAASTSKKTQKQFMYVLSRGELDMVHAAESWRFQQQHRRSLITDINIKSLAKIAPDDVLYIHCHMYVDKNHNPIGLVGGITNAKSKNEMKLNSEQLAAHLEERGLSKDHKIMKLFCCYSDSMQLDLYKALNEKGFNKVILHCYSGETTLAGKGFHKAAGLTLDEANKLKGEFLNKNGELELYLPQNILEDKHRAKDNRVIMDREKYMELTTPINNEPRYSLRP